MVEQTRLKRKFWPRCAGRFSLIANLIKCNRIIATDFDLNLFAVVGRGILFSLQKIVVFLVALKRIRIFDRFTTFRWFQISNRCLYLFSYDIRYMETEVMFYFLKCFWNAFILLLEGILKSILLLNIISFMQLTARGKKL